MWKEQHWEVKEMNTEWENREEKRMCQCPCFENERERCCEENQQQGRRNPSCLECVRKEQKEDPLQHEKKLLQVGMDEEDVAGAMGVGTGRGACAACKNLRPLSASLPIHHTVFKEEKNIDKKNQQ